MPAIKINGKRLSFGASGAGTTVVALHCSASTGAQWQSLSEHLMQDMCVFTPDLAGYGGSDPWPGGPVQSLKSEADFIYGLIDAWEEPVHLVGHSFGGAVALQIALEYPEWVSSLTLIEPTVFHLLRDGDAADRRLHATMAALSGALNASAALGNPSSGMAQFIDFWNGHGAWARTNPALRSYLAGQIGQVINNFAAGEAEHWALEACEKISCPTLAVMGTDSPAPAQRITEMLAETIPGAQLRIVDGTGHMMPLTDPHIIDPMIASHVGSAEAAIADQQTIHWLPQAA